MVCNVITADKANRLFWLGRYAQRVYVSLHLLRRYYDKMIDGDMKDLKEYFDYLGLEGCEQSEEFVLSQLYDQCNICSIAASLNGAKDNGIVLRHDITSESLSYIEMSRVLLDECCADHEMNITHLQPVTDYMLAFFGSVEERVFNDSVRNFLKMGRLIEGIDLRTRFHYPFFRIEELFASFKSVVTKSGAVIDYAMLDSLEDMISESRYAPSDEQYRKSLLSRLNRVVMV